MFRNLTVNTVRGALLNLAITADLERYIAKPQRGKVAVNRIADYKQLWTSIGKKTGIISSQRTYVLWASTLEDVKE